ncbi:MAG: hypothetical protein FJZ49_04550 [Candidatus Verstraetearchaeota archaeon]|nr:hypothetical protein [Candidatus Verstraetearchaeota archaeon]
MDDGQKGRMRSILRDKDLARLGDSFVNLIYSTAKTKASGKPVGEKVPDRVLSQALEIAKLPVQMRLTHGERGDAVEAVLAYAWMHNLLPLEEAVTILYTTISGAEYESRSLEREISAKAFSRLIRVAVDRIEGADCG